MSKFMLGNVFLLLFMLLSSSSQVLVKQLVDGAKPFQLSWEWFHSFCDREVLVRGTLAISMMGAGLVCWLLSLTKLSLSYAYPVACTSVFLVAIFSVLFLGESMTPRMWLGLALTVAGISLLIPPDG